MRTQIDVELETFGDFWELRVALLQARCLHSRWDVPQEGTVSKENVHTCYVYAKL